MDSIEERVKKVFIHCYDGLDERQSAYVQGAYEQLEIDVEKACEWLDNLMFAFGYDAIDREENLKDFRKEMKEDEPLEVTMKQEDTTLALSDNNAQQINHVLAMYATPQQEVTKLREENAYWRAKFEDLKKLVLNQY